MFFVYVLCDGKRIYVGFTEDVFRRFAEHKRGKVHTTKRFNQKNLKLIFYEAFAAKEDAIRREKYLKTGKGKKALKMMLRKSLDICRVV